MSVRSAFPTVTVNCRTWPWNWVCPMSAITISIPASPSMPRTADFRSITTAACCACAVCGSAMKLRGRIPGMSWGAASPRRSSPISTSPGGHRRPARMRQMRAGLSDRGIVGKRQVGGGNDQTPPVPALPADDAREAGGVMAKIGLATTWLDGCSGCHMSFLDIDELLIDLADKVEILFSPLVDCKIFPEHADITLVEGAVSSEADRKNIMAIRNEAGSWSRSAIAPLPPMCRACATDSRWKRSCGRSYVENADPARPGGEGIALPGSPAPLPDGQTGSRIRPRRCFSARLSAVTRRRLSISCPNCWQAVFPI